MPVPPFWRRCRTLAFGHTAAWLNERSINLDEALLRRLENAVITESIFNG
jgi:hypothetical protein